MTRLRKQNSRCWQCVVGRLRLSRLPPTKFSRMCTCESARAESTTVHPVKPVKGCPPLRKACMQII